MVFEAVISGFSFGDCGSNDTEPVKSGFAGNGIFRRLELIEL
jgi:hypothetical protein